MMRMMNCRLTARTQSNPLLYTTYLPFIKYINCPFRACFDHGGTHMPVGCCVRPLDARLTDGHQSEIEFPVEHWDIHTYVVKSAYFFVLLFSSISYITTRR